MHALQVRCAGDEGGGEQLEMALHRRICGRSEYSSSSGVLEREKSEKENVYVDIEKDT